MVEVYFYIPAEQTEVVADCGMKLSQWCGREVEIDGYKKKCISALLNPRDDMKKYNSKEYKCIKLEVMTKYCYVADGLLFQVGTSIPEVMDIYIKSIVPVDEYTFGRYRLPEILVTSTITSEYITILDGRLDSPILFNNSEELYINNIIESNKEMNDSFSDALLYYFYSKLSDIGKVRKIEDNLSKTAVFVEDESKKTFTIRVPDIEGFNAI